MFISFFYLISNKSNYKHDFDFYILKMLVGFFLVSEIILQ